MNKTRQILASIAGLVMLSFSVASQAGLVLMLDSGCGNATCRVTISDGGVADADGQGSVSFNGILQNWSIYSTNGTSFSNPSQLILGSMQNLQVSSNTGGTLTISLWDDGYTNNFSTTPGLQYQTVNTANTLSGNGTVAFTSLFINNGITTVLANSTGNSNNATTTAGFVNGTGGTFTLKQVATITQYGRGTSVISMSTTVPEPATLGLLGIGLVGLAFVRRRQITQ